MSKDQIGYTAQELKELIDKLLGQRLEFDKAVHEKQVNEVIGEVEGSSIGEVALTEAMYARQMANMFASILPVLLEENNRRLIEDFKNLNKEQ